ncbi:hypothetical protein BKH46_04835 [Helicobacter sp. 12S02634-8]|uniref:formyltransferase family protein n=1 Tax=Helicobacter sp. 12S02634-8 TaxID=1476199 RepID=UPI000BA6BDA0|nr:formyltransferase family protein [Helicobacter sp. 12S02634-8]PAF47049.1 hypothetical protein BKH46_04835 [Helicobacter sp. 12S02634-8]
MPYQTIILIGQGTIALNVLKNLLEYAPKLCILSYKPHSFCILKTFCQAQGLPYKSFQESLSVTTFLDSIDSNNSNNSKTLIISANNHYIFPAPIISKPNLTIINFHNALLPLYKGVNAPMWSIYNQDTYTGITWHLVSTQLDSGAILIQKQLPLSPKYTCLELIKALMALGIEAFLQIKNDLLHNNLKPQAMPPSSLPPNKSSDLPNQGILDINWNRDQISAFLRSMDAIGVLPRPQISLNARHYSITNYSIDKPITPLAPNTFLLLKEGIYMLLALRGGGRRTNSLKFPPIHFPTSLSHLFPNPQNIFPTHSPYPSTANNAYLVDPQRLCV